ncbi:lactosylceramide 4-alpha-galactosyltransferase-like [Sitophilus oryzae]|uniref:Lactosylceramide 4-alpha-galactosyltransferase-like n=1 Tax=Sitophilus oryzae TaxID=7048 RepID=A0A6J2YIW6_SITOR|nr:lactosylceramide 4-alpha-galactosyltransferase-like [Sitophilus oryzae]XP_030763087.1 lactosylceramide 4-alpha-galactosyltransferase-like [Sitophilus oryzae]XP_030763088.1 lactosylceramide 4-alpha-galactosyltransferase-like [Sitophilus oryzae]XP_030763089.1 lactosylceramide 4-alpha-galactosyltransferase-like [Sitophilus oryzae]XP_030763090.1 lactosylceramide 4-alpha-galactosyltransferase-like [Sitophilus oryzae]XP_030763091.1 lactosylceramide 4-alpha-galactosyltransferase-like [Sitophilus o
MYLRIVKSRKKIILTLFAVIFLWVFLANFNIPLPTIIIKAYYWFKPNKSLFCHSIQSEHSLPDISFASPKKGKSIFFHETSCTSYIKGKITINSRQACAVESAARMNPDHEIYLLFSSPGNFKNNDSESDRFLAQLLQYHNVHIYHLDMDKYFENTPVENLWTSDRMKFSQYAQSHTSDVLRYLTLWKYGGIYLDLDVIVVRNLEDLGMNYAGVESERAIAAGIVGFSHIGDGHKYVTDCLNDLSLNFNGDDWGYNGPGTITRLLKRLCQTNKIEEMSGKNCQDFKIYPVNEFYAVPWWNWKWFFDKKHMEQVVSCTNISHIIHVWNKFSISRKIPVNSDVPYLRYAKKYCPNIVRECDDFF